MFFGNIHGDNLASKDVCESMAIEWCGCDRSIILYEWSERGESKYMHGDYQTIGMAQNLVEAQFTDLK